MSSSFSAQQYESAFKSQNLQNWTKPKLFKQRASSAEGHTSFIATDRGHLLPGVKRGNAWTSFQGTWDLPSRIPPVHINPTARSREGQERLMTRGQSQRLVQSGSDKPYEGHGGSRATSRTSCDKDTDVDQTHEEPHIPASTGPDGPETLQKPMLSSSRAQSRPATQQSQAQSRPASQQNQGESQPAPQPINAESQQN